VRNAETNIQNACLLAAGSDSSVLVWRQQSGVLRAFDDPRRVVKVGVPGMSDLLAVVAVQITEDMVGKTVGVAVAAEIKTDTGKQRPNQRLWQDAFQRRGGIYALIRSPAEMLGLIARVQRGEW